MRRVNGFCSVLCVILICGVYSAAAHAAEKPADRLLPENTKGIFWVPNLQRMQQSWDHIELGKLAADPAVKPFVEDLQAQIQTRIDSTGLRMGIGIEDLLDVCAGDVAVAFIEPREGNQKHAVAAMADITGKANAVDKLLKKVDENMQKRGATRDDKKLGEIEVTIYTVPVKKGARKTFKAVLFQAGNRLFAVDHEDTAIEIMKIVQGANLPVLADQPAYRKTFDRIEKEQQEAPHLVWWVEPIAYARVAREAAAVQRRQRTDLLQAVANQGFEALRGMGGFLTLGKGDFELLYRGYLYAPPVAEAGEERYELAARLLAFPGDDPLDIQAWIPEGVSSYASATWDIQSSYQYIGALIDEIAGEEGFFEDLKTSLLEDPNGPMISLDDDIVAHLGRRVTIITDCRTPLTVDSERFLVAISLKDAKALSKSLERTLDSDPDARPVEVDGQQMWEIIQEEEDAYDAAGDGFDSFGGFGPAIEEQPAEEEQVSLMTNSAITVLHDHLIIASHVDFIVDLMRRDPTEPRLNDSPDFKSVRNALVQLGSTDDDTAQLFSRSDEELRASYHLIREGKMPESKGLIGQVLNRLLSPQEKGVVREQRIDGEKMPEYQVVRRYLGPVGAFIVTEEEGWYAAAVGLTKQAPIEPSMNPAVNTAELELETGETN